MRSRFGGVRAAVGTTYVGEWKEGKRHGAGRMTFTDGSIYMGDWKYGKRHGRGTYTYKCGDYYTGGWSAGAKHGAGRYVQVIMGVTYEGTWRNGKLVASK